MRIAVAGATGLVGRRLVRELAGRGHETVSLVRSTGVDLAQSVGLEGRLGGADGVPFGYDEGELRQEGLITASGFPSTILRATKLHEFAGQILERVSIGPVAAVLRMRVQPIAVREVAAALADTVLDRPSGRPPDLAGPAQENLVEMTGVLLRARRRRRLVMAVRVPGAGGGAMRAGRRLPPATYTRGRLTFAQWLDTEGGREWL